MRARVCVCVCHPVRVDCRLCVMGSVWCVRVAMTTFYCKLTFTLVLHKLLMVLMGDSAEWEKVACTCWFCLCPFFSEEETYQRQFPNHDTGYDIKYIILTAYFYDNHLFLQKQCWLAGWSSFCGTLYICVYVHAHKSTYAYRFIYIYTHTDQGTHIYANAIINYLLSLLTLPWWRHYFHCIKF